MSNEKLFICSIIHRQTLDFLEGHGEYKKMTTEKKLEKFKRYCENCEWFVWVDLDREWYFNECKKKLEELKNEKKTYSKKIFKF